MVQVGAGVVYVQVNVPDMFGQELATAIDFQVHYDACKTGCDNQWVGRMSGIIDNVGAVC